MMETKLYNLNHEGTQGTRKDISCLRDLCTFMVHNFLFFRKGSLSNGEFAKASIKHAVIFMQIMGQFFFQGGARTVTSPAGESLRGLKLCQARLMRVAKKTTSTLAQACLRLGQYDTVVNTLENRTGDGR